MAVGFFVEDARLPAGNLPNKLDEHFSATFIYIISKYVIMYTSMHIYIYIYPSFVCLHTHTIIQPPAENMPMLTKP